MTTALPQYQSSWFNSGMVIRLAIRSLAKSRDEHWFQYSEQPRYHFLICEVRRRGAISVQQTRVSPETRLQDVSDNCSITRQWGGLGEFILVCCKLAAGECMKAAHKSPVRSSCADCEWEGDQTRWLNAPISPSCSAKWLPPCFHSLHFDSGRLSFTWKLY